MSIGDPYYFTLQLNHKLSTTPENQKLLEQMPPEKMSFEFHPSEIEERVITPRYTKIIQYIKRILQAANDSIDGIIFVGGLCKNESTRELIADACIKTGINFFIDSGKIIEEGATLKFVTEVGAREFKPEILFDIGGPQLSQTQDVFVFTGKKDTL